MKPTRVPRKESQSIRRLLAVLLVSLLVYVGFGVTTVIPAGGTLTIGGTAAEPNGSNKQGGYIVFEPGSTLVLTQINNSATIWATLVATNGDAYLRADMPRDRQPSIQGHVFAYGAGSLTFSGVNSVRLGHAQYFPVCNLANLHADAQLSTFAINSCTLMAFPQDPSFPTFISSEADIHLMGDADMLAGDELAVPRGKVSLCNSTAVPAGKTVRVSGSGSVMVQPLRFTFAGAACPEACSSLANLTAPDTNALTLACSLASAGRPLVFTNAVPVTLAGTVSGNGRLELAGSAEVTLATANPDAQQTIVPTVDDVALVLGNAQAAAHMKVSPAAAMTIRGGEGLPAVALEEVLATEESAPCTFLAAANQTVTVAAAAGNLAAGGAGVDAGSAVTFGMLAPGAQVLDEGTATVRYGSSETPPEGCVTATLSDGRSLVALPVAGAIDAAALAAKRNNNWPILCYDVMDGGTVVSGSDAVTLRTPQAATVTLKTDGGETFAVAGEGTFAVTNRASLVDQVAYWYDFSRPETCFRIGEGTTDEFLGRELSEGVPFIERVVDWRQPEAYYSLWNRRLYKSETTLECVEMVYPVRLSDGPDGLGYLSMDAAGGSRRLPFAPPSGYNTMASVAAQLVVMVFGSQKGGGYALVATTEGALGRSGTKATSGITTNTLHDIWLDGVKVANPAAQQLNGGWQVVSIALDGLHFSGLGMLKDTSGNRGGQQYGEVLVFTNAVSTRVRLQAEQYLAKKWGLIDQYAPAAQTELAELTRGIVCRVKAAGAPTLVGDGRTLEVSGAFSGTVKLNGGSLAVPERRLPYTEAEIPSANRLYWADPDDAGAVLRYADLQPGDAAQRPDEVRALKDKVLRDFAVGQPVLFGIGTRMPYATTCARGFGPTRTWLDFNNGRANDSNGNNLRFWDYTADINWRDPRDGTMATMNIQTAFFVQDSFRGGGNPLMNTVGGSNNGVQIRTRHAPAESMWPYDRPAAYVNGENRLNSEVVDYRNGFTGLPEVFTLRATAPYNSAYVGHYMNSENGALYGEMMGEMLFYSTALPDEDVLGIEAYLMGKWLGTLPPGFADLRGATVTGTGRVEVAQAAQRPNVDPSFAGTVAIAAGEAFKMTVDPATGRVAGALNCPQATLELPAACTLTLDFTALPGATGDVQNHVLVDCAQFAAPVAWTLVKGANVPRRGRFVQTGNQIAFRVSPAGFAVNIR